MKKQRKKIKLKSYKTSILLLITFIGLSSIVFSLVNILQSSKYNIIEDPIGEVYAEEIIIHNRSIYKSYPSEGEYIGTLYIPILDITFPIYEGTSENEFKKGLGHYIKSALPGETNNSVISGHRVTPFKGIGKLKIDDLTIIKTSAGEFTYKVHNIKIVNKDDRTVIVSTKKPVLTLTTCYPFYYIGASPSRYIVSSTLIKSDLFKKSN